MPRSTTPNEVRIISTWVNRPITTQATIGSGTRGMWKPTAVLSQSGALPPGDGSSRIASPSQTNDRPSVTTIEGSCRHCTSAPTAA